MREVSIPLWFDYNRENCNCTFSFQISLNSTMVRLQLSIRAAERIYRRGLNSTIVRLQPRQFGTQVYLVTRLNSTMVRLQQGLRLRALLSMYFVSIPLWFDYNFDRRRISGNGLFVSIPLWFDYNYTKILNFLFRLIGLNSTMVRLQQKGTI